MCIVQKACVLKRHVYKRVCKEFSWLKFHMIYKYFCHLAFLLTTKLSSLNHNIFVQTFSCSKLLAMWPKICTKQKNLPTIELLSAPNAQIQGGPFGTVNLQNDQLDEKYFGRKLALARDDCLFSFGSSKAKMCTVP